MLLLLICSDTLFFANPLFKKDNVLNVYTYTRDNMLMHIVIILLLTYLLTHKQD
jgi:hypothetical protein